jgi:autotransporter strand-loop-strand O-heptosyltransferase
MEKNDNIETEILKDKIQFNFTDGVGISVENLEEGVDKNYNIELFNSHTNELLESGIINSGEKFISNIKYFIPWRIVVKYGETVIKDYTINLENRNVLITFESSALGDTIAWFPHIEEFRKKHRCIMIVSSFHNELFQSEYPNIHFVDRGKPIQGIHFVYKLGWFGAGLASNKNPRSCQDIPLQAVSTDILGLEYEEIIPKIKRCNKPSIIKPRIKSKTKKYVCVTTCATAQFKFWNHPTGWQEVVDYLVSKGYAVVNIGKMPNYLKNVIDFTGKRPFDDLINILSYSEFFVCLASGLSFLNIASGKKSITITAIVEDYCEFNYNNYKVVNPLSNICKGCASNKKYEFQKNDWLYCPEYKNTTRMFECSKTITPKMVIEKIESAIEDIKNGVDVNIPIRKIYNV